MAQLDNNFENGLADGTTLSSSNSGDGSAGDAFDFFQPSGIREVDTDIVLHGTRSVRLATSASTDIPHFKWLSSWSGISTAGTVYFRVYFRVNNNTPSSNTLIAVFYESDGSTVGCDMRLSSTGYIQLRAPQTLRATSSLQIPVDTWVRMEVQVISAASGDMNCRLFVGSNVEGTTPDLEFSFSPNRDTGDGTVGGIAWGICASSGTSGLEMNVDSVALSDVDWLGPVGGGGPSGTAALSLARSTGAGSGSTGTEGSAAVSLVRYAGSGSGSTTGLVGTGAPSLARHSGSGSGSTAAPGTAGSAAVSLVRHSGSAAGSTGTQGSGSAALVRDTAAGLGSSGTSGSAAVALSRNTAAGSGSTGSTGTGGLVLARSVGAGSGSTTIAPVTGTSSAALARHTGSGSGTIANIEPITGFGLTAPLISHTAAGEGSTGTPGSGALSLSRVAMAATGDGTVIGAGFGDGRFGQMPFGQGEATALPVGSAAPTLIAHTAAGTGTTSGGSGALELQRATAEGSGSCAEPTIYASADPELVRHTGAGTGSTQIIGTVVAELVRHSASGTGLTFNDSSGTGLLSLTRHIMTGGGTATVVVPGAQIPRRRLQGAHLTGLTKDARRTEILRARAAEELDARIAALEP